MCHSRTDINLIDFICFSKKRSLHQTRCFSLFYFSFFQFFLFFVDGKTFIWINFCRARFELIKKEPKSFLCKTFVIRRNLFSSPAFVNLDFQLISTTWHSEPADKSRASQRPRAASCCWTYQFFTTFSKTFSYKLSTSLCNIFNFLFLVSRNYLPIISFLAWKW